MWCKKFWKDVAERVVWTFAQAFLAAWVITGGSKALESASIAGAAAVAALLKGVAAHKIGDPESASTVPSI